MTWSWDQQSGWHDLTPAKANLANLKVKIPAGIHVPAQSKAD